MKLRLLAIGCLVLLGLIPEAPPVFGDGTRARVVAPGYQSYAPYANNNVQLQKFSYLSMRGDMYGNYRDDSDIEIELTDEALDRIADRVVQKLVQLGAIRIPGEEEPPPARQEGKPPANKPPANKPVNKPANKPFDQSGKPDKGIIRAGAKPDPFEIILKTNCMSCHSGNEPKGGLRMFTVNGTMEKLSRETRWDIWDRVTRNDDHHMPPSPRQSLKFDEVGILRAAAQSRNPS